MTPRVLIADAYQLSADAIRRVLDSEPDLEVAGQALTCSTALAALDEQAVDVLLLEMDMTDMDGIECLDRVVSRHPEVAVVMMAHERMPDRIEVALRHGARGCILKSIEPRDLGAAIRQLLAGTVYAATGAKPTDDSSMHLGLTEREQTMLVAVAGGLSNREIGQRLWVTEQTVKFHLNNLYRKLGVPNRTAAARYAYQHGLSRDPW